MEPTIAELPLSPANPPEKRGIAPVWHTIVFIAIFAGMSLAGTKRGAAVAESGGGRIGRFTWRRS